MPIYLNFSQNTVWGINKKVFLMLPQTVNWYSKNKSVLICRHNLVKNGPILEIQMAKYHNFSLAIQIFNNILYFQYLLFTYQVFSGVLNILKHLYLSQNKVFLCSRHYIWWLFEPRLICWVILNPESSSCRVETWV